MYFDQFIFVIRLLINIDELWIPLFKAFLNYSSYDLNIYLHLRYSYSSLILKRDLYIYLIIIKRF